MLRPVRPIEAMQTKEEKRTRKKLQTVPSPCGRGSQKQETGGQANDAFHNSGSPVHGGKSLGSASFHVINHCQNESDNRERQIPPVGTGAPGYRSEEHTSELQS